MKKAGVITIVKDAVDESFGPATQILAVQKYLKNYDIEAEAIIDEHNTTNIFGKILRVVDEIKNGKNGFELIRLKIKQKYSKSKLNTKDEIKELIDNRRKSYKKFIDKYVKISTLKENDLNTKNNILKTYDYFIVGSDQVWNPYYPQKSEIKYLRFCPKEKRIAFSPSIARNNIPLRFRKDFIKGINGFANISVREEKGAELIKKYTGKNAVVLADTTMLIEADFWKNIEIKPECKIPPKYLLAYFMGNTDSDKIKKIAKRENLDIIWLRNFDYKDYYILNPMEYIYLINRAEIICTDSFHMSVFSILLEKRFIVFERDGLKTSGMSSRLDTLLAKFNLNARLYNEKNFEEYFKYPNFEKNSEVLDQERHKAKIYFDNIFK